MSLGGNQIIDWTGVNAGTIDTSNIDTGTSAGSIFRKLGTSGFVGIGTTSPIVPLHIATIVEEDEASISAANRSYFHYSGHAVNSSNSLGYIISNNGAWSGGVGAEISIHTTQSIVSKTYIIAHAGTLSSSDDRIKTEETPIKNATETLLKITPKNYFKHPTYRVDEDDESAIPEKDLSGDIIEKFWESGVIAQDLIKIPELQHLVGFSPDITGGVGILTMNYTGLIPYLIKSNQELNERIKQLENKSP